MDATTEPARGAAKSGRSTAKLDHIPGTDGLPLFGESFVFLRDPMAWVFNAHKRYGPIFRTFMFFERGVSVSGADFAERFFLDKEQIFSSELGWQNLLARFFKNGLMLRDFAEHRLHRRIMQVAFKREALTAYFAILQPMFERAVQALGTGGPMRVYPWVKQLTLDGAAAVFLGLDSSAPTRRE